MRGSDLSNALVELLCVGMWGELDLLLMDMPPGIGDQILDLLRFVPRLECVLVTTSSRVATRVAGRLLEVLLEAGAAVPGVLVNMSRAASPVLGPQPGAPQPGAPQPGTPESGPPMARVPLLGTLPYDETFEEAIGDPERLIQGSFAAALLRALDGLRIGPTS
jgi:ATP-binding protein involved in chromosome partitioning